MILNLPEIAVSVQVLNELANVLMKKFSFSETNTGEFIDEICKEFEVAPLTHHTKSTDIEKRLFT